jgi:hypothetical protein
MCLLIHSEPSVEIYWIHQTLFVAPDGPLKPHETEIIINGIVKPSGPSNKLSFLHLGKISGLENYTNQWTDVLDDLSSDWFVSKILNNPEVYEAGNRIAKCDQGRGFKFRINPFQNRSTPSFCVDTTVASVQAEVSKICYFHRNEEKDDGGSASLAGEDKPICSMFSLTFKDDAAQLFRLRFRTDYYKPLHSQVVVSIDGTKQYYKDIRHLADKPKKKLENIIEHSKLPNEVVIIGHPQMTLNFESRMWADFEVESKEIPSIHSAACLSRAALFLVDKFDVAIKATSPIPEPYSSFSPDYLDFRGQFSRELDDFDKKNRKG